MRFFTIYLYNAMLNNIRMQILFSIQLSIIQLFFLFCLNLFLLYEHVSRQKVFKNHRLLNCEPALCECENLLVVVCLTLGCVCYHSRRSDAFVRWSRRRVRRDAAVPPRPRRPCRSKLPPHLHDDPRAPSAPSPSSPRNTRRLASLTASGRGADTVLVTTYQ